MSTVHKAFSPPLNDGPQADEDMGIHNMDITRQLKFWDFATKPKKKVNCVRLKLVPVNQREILISSGNTETSASQFENTS